MIKHHKVFIAAVVTVTFLIFLGLRWVFPDMSSDERDRILASIIATATFLFFGYEFYGTMKLGTLILATVFISLFGMLIFHLALSYSGSLSTPALAIAVSAWWWIAYAGMERFSVRDDELR